MANTKNAQTHLSACAFIFCKWSVMWKSQLTFGFAIIVPLRLRKGKVVGETIPTESGFFGYI